MRCFGNQYGLAFGWIWGLILPAKLLQEYRNG